MKRIGILGGMSPASTAAYYRIITQRYTELYGDYGYPEIIIYSVSFQPYVDWPEAGRWDKVAGGLSEAAQRLEAVGADFVLIATNTMHLVVDKVREAIHIPVLSLLDVVGDALEEEGITQVGLLGTSFTMESDLYPEALGPRGIQVLVPDAEARQEVNRVIYEELVADRMIASSRASYVQIIESLISRGAEGVILGCTEIPLLVRSSDVEVPLFDTTRMHAEAGLAFALA